MKILGISFGGRNGSNDAMCKEALRAAKELGAEIEFLRPLELDLKPCNGCVACVRKLVQGKNPICVIQDDFPWLDDKIAGADGLLFFLPIFEKGAPASFKILHDRLCGPSHDRAFMMACQQIAGKTGNEGPDPRYLVPDKPVSFVMIGGSDWTTRVACDVQLFAMTPEWKIIDQLVFPWSKAIVAEDDKVAQCRQVGVNMVRALQDPAGARYQGDPGICPNCHSRNFYLGDGLNETICEVCGLVGELKAVGGKVIFEYPAEQVQHAHNNVSGKFHHLDDVKGNEMKIAELRKTEAFSQRMAEYRDFIQASVPNRL